MNNKYFNLCDVCEGQCEVEINKQMLDCGECDGQGYWPTEEGFELIKFLKLLEVFKYQKGETK